MIQITQHIHEIQLKLHIYNNTKLCGQFVLYIWAQKPSK